MFFNFFKALYLLQDPIENLVETFRPHFLGADSSSPWANSTAEKFGIPCICFHASGYFSQCITSNLLTHQPHMNVSSDSDTFVVPGNLPHEIKLTVSELSPYEKKGGSKFFLDFQGDVMEA